MNRAMAFLAIMAAALFGAAPAKAGSVYDYAFGSNASGTFTTGAASLLDPGYYDLTSLTVTSFTDNTLGPVVVNISVEAGEFQPGAAYNPTTGAFVNHAFGFTFDNLGDTGTNSGHDVGTINGQPINIFTGDSFSLGSSQLYIVANFVNYRANGPLTIIAAPVPEPSSLTLLAAGGLVLVACGRRTRSRKVARKQG